MSAAALLVLVASSAVAQVLFPANNAKGVNPDVQLKLTFSQPPVVGKSGKVRIYDMGGKDSTLDVAKAIADYAS